MNKIKLCIDLLAGTIILLAILSLISYIVYFMFHESFFGGLAISLLTLSGIWLNMEYRE